jgi:pimeloyl-ACP methyl ester carboxylesterase
MPFDRNVLQIDPGKHDYFEGKWSGPIATGEYDPHNALWFNELSALMYVTDKDRIGRMLEPAGLTGHHPSGTEGGMRAAIFDADDFHVLAFCGTEIRTLAAFVADLHTDAKAELRPWDIGNAHGGIQSSLTTVKDLIDEFGRLSGTLYCTGHSLGGALAALAAYRLRGKLTATYTFGAPMVGDAVFAHGLEDLPLHRVAMRLDPIPTLPDDPLPELSKLNVFDLPTPLNVVFGGVYKHAGHEHPIGIGGVRFIAFHDPRIYRAALIQQGALRAPRR